MDRDSEVSAAVERAAKDLRDLYNLGVADGKLEAKRPEGRWFPKTFHSVGCLGCGFELDLIKTEHIEEYFFCPRCGMSMGGNHDGKES